MNPASIIARIFNTARTSQVLAVLLFVAIITVIIISYGAITSGLVILAQTWIIQTLVAAWVAFQLQQVALSNTRKRDRLQATYNRKIEAAKALYSLISKRIYATRTYLDVIEGEPSKIPEERERYRPVVTEWNEKAQLHQVTILLEFESYFGLLIDHEYNPTFSYLDRSLRRQRILVQSGSPASGALSREVRSRLAELNRISLDVFREMLKHASKERNIMDEKVEISEPNMDHISYGRLLKALVHPGV